MMKIGRGRGILVRLSLGLVLTLTALIGVTAARAEAAAIGVRGACSPASGTAPRGEACVYLLYDAAAGKVGVQGVVNPRGGHVWRILKLEVYGCTPAYCGTGPRLSQGPYAYTSQLQKVTVGSVAAGCGTWSAQMLYEVDYQHLAVFEVSTYDNPYPIRCSGPV